MANVAVRRSTVYRKFNLWKAVGNTLLFVTVAVVALLTIFPIYWMLVSTFQPSEFTLHYPPPLIPQQITFNQFALLFDNHPVAL